MRLKPNTAILTAPGEDYRQQLSRPAPLVEMIDRNRELEVRMTVR